MIILLLFQLTGSFDETDQVTTEYDLYTDELVYGTDAPTIGYSTEPIVYIRLHKPIYVLINCALYRIGI